jgi:DNA primase
LAVAGESGLKNGATVLFCEGEFDRAVLLDQLSQTGEAVTILTMGSASQRIPTRLIGKLRLAKAIYLCLDADEAGRTASEKLARQLGMNRCYLLPFPDGSKDACDYYETAGANAIREWWVNRVAHRAKVVL